MSALPAHKAAVIRTLVQTAPDGVVGRLEAALKGVSGDPALEAVRALVDAEAGDRRLRNLVLAPIAAICVGDGADPGQLRFPAAALGLVWRGLKAAAPDEVAAAEGALSELAAVGHARHYDILADIAAERVRADLAGPFRAAAEACDACRPNGAAQFAACLDLSPVVRAATARLPEWITKVTPESAAAARVAYDDALAIAPDAGPRFVEMLAAQLARPWQVLRLVSTVMDRPGEAFVAASEFGPFALRALDAIDAALNRFAAFVIDSEPTGRIAADIVDLAVEQIAELETSIGLSRDGRWGLRVAAQKRRLADLVEARFRHTEKAFLAALPMQMARVARVLKSVPRLDPPPNRQHTAKIVAHLAFIRDIRAAASPGGFSSGRSRLIDRLGESLDIYVEDVLDRLRHDEVEDPPAAHAFLAVAAEVATVLRDERAGAIILRRAAAG